MFEWLFAWFHKYLTISSFISSRTSRSPLGCSKEQLKQILTHREVMAPFLDFVFKFRQRGEPETLTSFRIEDWLYHTNVSFADQSLRRSGFRIQHCFNLIAVELGENQDWTLRQNATYHSFDPVNGQAFWLNLKGNDEVSKRLKKSIPAHPLLRPSALTSPEARFMATLVTHLIIIQWCVENWPKYVDDLQKALREQLDKVRLGPVTHLTEPENIEKVAAFRRGNTMNSAIGMPPPSRKSTLQKRTSFKAPELVKRLSGRIFKDSSKARSPSPEKHKEDDIDLDFDDLYSFKELQNLGQLGDTMQQSVLVLGQNINIIDDLVARYEGLMNSSEFKQHVKTTECQFGMNTFRSRSQQHIRSMESCVLRLNNIIGTLESAMDQFHGILQYRNIKTSEYFAQSAHDSTKVMEHMAIKTKQETVSMHSITILTLVFLPGTFLAVSTLLSALSLAPHMPTTIPRSHWLPGSLLHALGTCRPSLAAASCAGTKKAETGRQESQDCVCFSQYVCL